MGLPGIRANKVHRLLSAAGTSDDATLIHAGGTELWEVFGYNAATATRYLKFYDKATAPGTSDTPVFTIALPPSLPFFIPFVGYHFVNGLGYRIVQLSGDSDGTDVTAGDILGLNVCHRY